MKLTIESTDQVVQVNGVPARVWEGTTDDGVPVQLLVTRIAVTDLEANTTAFDNELMRCVPVRVADAFPLRMVL